MTQRINPDAWDDTEFLRWASLRTALVNGDIALLAEVIGGGLDVNLQMPKFNQYRKFQSGKRERHITISVDRSTSPLHQAARRSKIDAVELLLANGANVNFPSLNGSTALHESVLACNSGITSLLIKNGIDVNRKVFLEFPYGDAMTALHIALQSMYLDIAKLLLNNGARTDTKCVELALQNHDFRTLQLLLQHGAPLDVLSARVDTARTTAKWKGQRVLGQLLSGHYPIPNFVALSSAQLDQVVDECIRPEGTVIETLRDSLKRWINQPNQESIDVKYKLCSNCERITQRTLMMPSDNTMIVKRNPCPLCRIIFDKMLPRANETDLNGQLIEVDFPNAVPTIRGITSGTFSIGLPRGQLAQVLSRLQLCNDSGTGSEGTIALARAWFLQCLTEHPECSAALATLPQLPTRVIDVGCDDQEPRLIITQRRPGIYCALSYCWGRQPFLRTTKSTLSAHMKCIALQDLPKTLKDAVMICRQLGIEYIWIDALCIVQDDAEDWARESRCMASIYRDAIVTIIAAKANDTTEGCFQPRSRNRTWPVKTPDHLTRDSRMNAQSGKYAIWNLSTDFWSPSPPHDPDFPHENLYVFPDYLPKERGPTDSRAWCAQEHFLSCRVLYFSSELFWECRCFFASEARPGGTRNSSFISAKNAREVSLRTGYEVIDETELDTVLTDWENVIGDYTQRQITKQSDRLIALAGMASVVGKSVGCDFLAGIWNGKHLCRSLLWEVRNADLVEHDSSYDTDQAYIQRIGWNKHNLVDVGKREPDQDIFPSWCWASHLSGNGRILYSRWDEPMKANRRPSRTPHEIADVISTQVDEIFTKDAVRGTIVLKGRLRRMKVVEGRIGMNASGMANNMVKIVPAMEEVEENEQDSGSPKKEDDDFLEYRHIQRAPTNEIVEKTAFNGFPGHVGDSEVDNEAMPYGNKISHAFGNNLFASLQRLEQLQAQQDNNRQVIVPVQKRKHFWIKDRVECCLKEVYALPIAFWEDEMVGLCLQETEMNGEYRRVGLCSIGQSQVQGWEVDEVFESWKTVESTIVSIV